MTRRFPRTAHRAASAAAALAIVLAMSGGAAMAQQPNSASATMTINGANGPPYPILTTVHVSLPATIQFGTLPNQPYALFQGTLHPGQAAFANGLVDLALSPFPVTILSGFADPQFYTDSTGHASFTVTVPNAGSPPNGVPLGFQISLQSVVGAPFNPPYGYRLTAATRITVVQGPLVVNLTLGDDDAALVGLGSAFTIPFYGTAYSQLWIGSNGLITFGGPDTSPFATLAGFSSGYPRIAPFWTDLDPSAVPAGAVRYTLDPNPSPGSAPFLLVEWTSVPDWAAAIPHTFSAYVDQTGVVRTSYAIVNWPSLYNTICGISPGQGTVPPPMTDFTVVQAAGGAYGAVNTAFFESFPGPSTYPGPNSPSSNPFDLFGKTLHFVPSGVGPLPGASSSYFFY